MVYNGWYEVLSSTGTDVCIALCSWSLGVGAGTAKFFDVMMWIDGTPALSTIGDILARGSVQASTRS